jgi:UDP-glucose 4-epimerase
MIELGWLRDRPVLVTGAGGFLGAAVVRRLVALGARVRAWLGPAPSPALQLPPPDVAIGHGEITSPAAIEGQLEGVACVYHLAGPPSVAASYAAPAAYLSIHAAGTAALLERCIARGVARLVYVSSAEVYAPAASDERDEPSEGASQRPRRREVASAPRVHEDHPRAPRSPYGVAKHAAERCLELCAGEITTTIVRPFSVYGPGCAPASLIGTLVATVRRGEPPALADLRPVRDYCFVDDAADGIVRAGCRAERAPRAYNLASGRGTSVREVAEAVLRVAGRQDLAIGARTADRPAAALTLALIGDPTRAHAELGFTATTSLDDGLRHMLARPPCHPTLTTEPA